MSDEIVRLKHELAERHRADREAYTEAKTDFVRRVDELARREESTESGRLAR